MDGTVVCVMQLYARSDTYIVVTVALALLMQRAPRAEVAPSEGGGEDKDFFRLFHHGVVNRDGRTFGKLAIDDLLLLGCTIEWQQGFKDIRYLRGLDAQGIDNR